MNKNSKTIGILTFHASHNFGAMLQSFALQQILGRLGYTCENINFRCEQQRLHRRGEWHKPTNGWRGVIGKLLLLPWRKDLIGKFNKFEEFLQKDLHCSAPYFTEQEVLQKALHYDIYLAGSDQIWNTVVLDFSWLYFLPFKAAKKIAYAPSLGDESELNLPHKDKICNYLADFNAISVREASGADFLASLGLKRPPVMLDPTLLLTAEEWAQHISKTPLVKGDYLYVYTPYRKAKIAQIIPQDTKLPCVFSTMSSWQTLYNPRFKKCFNSGPWEFLNLIYHSKGVVSGSFHAAVFAKLFNKPLYCLDMGPGSRIANLEEKFKNIDEERAKSIRFLQEALQ